MSSVTTAEHFGGATNITIGADTPLNTNYRLWRVTNTGGSTVKLIFPPTATLGLQLGGPIFIIANVGLNTFVCRDFENQLPSLNLTTNKAIIVSMYQLGCMPQWAPHFGLFNYSSS